MRLDKKPRRWPWIVLILVLLGIIAALGYGYWSKLQAESHLPVEDVDNPPPPVISAPHVPDTTPDEAAPFTCRISGFVDPAGAPLTEMHTILMGEFMDAWYTPLAEFTTPDTDSVLYDLPHIFIFDKDAATLYHHEADDNPYFSYTRAEDSDYDAEFARILRSIERRQLTRGEQTAVTLDCDHPYDRAAAYDYLMAYCDERNPRWYAYDDVGGNCMNFGSQVLLAGGIPEDERGDEEWYWDGQNDLDLSWINVGHFYDYCRDNEGYGLVADTEAGYYTGEVGDVVIVGFAGDHRHTTVISHVVEDEEGNVVDYLITCNTTNYKDFPVSAYYYTCHRLIKIFGWNEG